MLYTLLVLFTGVYLGQEFTVIPSVKVAILNLILYMKSNDTTNDINDTVDKHYSVTEIINWLKEKFKS